MVPDPVWGVELVVDDPEVLLPDVLLSFQAATIFLTEVNGDLGEAWGLLSGDAVGVTVFVTVGVYDDGV